MKTIDLEQIHNLHLQVVSAESEVREHVRAGNMELSERTAIQARLLRQRLFNRITPHLDFMLECASEKLMDSVVG